MCKTTSLLYIEKRRLINTGRMTETKKNITLLNEEQINDGKSLLFTEPCHVTLTFETCSCFSYLKSLA